METGSRARLFPVGFAEAYGDWEEESVLFDFSPSVSAKPIGERTRLFPFREEGSWQSQTNHRSFDDGLVSL